MLDYVRAAPADILSIKVQPQQRDALVAFSDPSAEDVMRASLAHAAYYRGRCIAAAGVTPKWPGSGTAWAILSEEAGQHMLEITRRCRHMLDIVPFVRLEAYAACDFPAAQRWLTMLGFELEVARARSYTPDGQDAAIFRRIKPWTP